MGLAARLPHLCSSWAGPVEFAALGVVSRRSAPPGQVDNSRVKKKNGFGGKFDLEFVLFQAYEMQ